MWEYLKTLPLIYQLIIIPMFAVPIYIIIFKSLKKKIKINKSGVTIEDQHNRRKSDRREQ